MLSLLQLLLAIFATYSAINFSEEQKLLVPLVCLFFMLLISRVDRANTEKKTERDSFLKSEIDKTMKKELPNIKDEDFSTIESLLWPKNELLLIDSVHSIFKGLGFRISAGINYHSVDRIVKIPNTQKVFGVEILMSESETEKSHPKLRRALEFEKEKKDDEKTLIIASTHIRLPLSERGQVKDISGELVDFLTQHNMSFMTTYHLYELWQKSKGGENDIFGVFQKLYSHSGGIFDLKETENSRPLSFELPIQ
jgi:hypothetical protein